MAGPSIGTWVKVRNKSGRLTARVMANKFGGGSYEQGEVITQSEFKKFQKERVSQMDARKRQLERKKERAKEDRLKLEPRGTQAQRDRDAARKASEDADKRMKNNESINEIGVKGKTQNRQFNIAHSETGIKAVKGSVRGSFGVHQDNGMIVLTHLPTGMSVVSLQKKMVRLKGGGELNTLAQVKKATLTLADKLNDVDGVGRADAGRDPKVLKSLRDIIVGTLDGRY